MTKWVYTFGDGKAEGGAKDKNLLGGKGANLAEMSSIGIPVPAGFTISTEVCTYFYEHGSTYPDDLKQQVEDALGKIEGIMSAKFGATSGPLLLVSVRSGARASMPGMMDTVLNLGLNDETVKTLTKNTGDERFAFDSYRRFIQMFSNVVLGVETHNFETLLEDYKEHVGKNFDVELSAEDWKALIVKYKEEIRKHIGHEFPQDPHEQLWGAIGAVFGSWMNKRAITYRKLNNLPDHWGTAVNIQAMVFGNMGDDSATGVCFSRNPSTGENAFYGEYLV
ncbi:MAG TPA: PEP/pyruvate-binding domain-containing protein, partial [Rhodospirillales bacterium]|nr:PEP/pyruvate-binding domain-containing protein [Rhodospirillales bacterium]